MWGYLHNNMVFRYKILSFFIIHQDLSFGGFALKIEFVVFVYELINDLFMKLLFLLLGYVMIDKHSIADAYTGTKAAQISKTCRL